MGLAMAIHRERQVAEATRQRLVEEYMASGNRPSYADLTELALSVHDADEPTSSADEGFGETDGRDDEFSSSSSEAEDEEEEENRLEQEASEAFFIAVSKKRYGKVRQLRDAWDNSSKWLRSDGAPPIVVAAMASDKRMVDLLLVLKCDGQGKDRNGWTALHHTVFHGMVDMTDALLQRGIDGLAADEQGCTPLMLASSSPKVYYEDMCTRKERRKRAGIKRRVYGEMLQHVASMKSAEAPHPAALWTLHPNRLEVLLMSSILTLVGAERAARAVLQADVSGRTALTYAARFGHEIAVSRLLAAKANVDHPDGRRQTPLFHAVLNLHARTVDVLLRCRASVNDYDFLMQYPLHVALRQEDVVVAKMLLEASSDVNSFDSQGKTPLMFAMDTGNKALFRMVLFNASQAPDLNVLDAQGRNTVIYSISNGLFPDLRPALLRMEQDALMASLRYQDPQGRTGLFHAILSENQEAIAFLHELDPQPAIHDCNGDTALHVACELGSVQTVDRLGSTAEDLDPVNLSGETPLMLACRGGHLACVIKLLDSVASLLPADCRCVDKLGRGIVHHAVASGNLDLVNLLLLNKSGTNRHLAIAFPPGSSVLNDSDKTGCTPMIAAVREGHWHLLPSLVLAAGNIEHRDNDGFSPLHWAAKEGESDCVATLLDLKAVLDRPNSAGNSPAMIAVIEGQCECAALLLDAKSNPMMRNHNNMSLVELAGRQKNQGVRSLVMEAVRGSVVGFDDALLRTCRGRLVVTLLEATSLCGPPEVGPQKVASYAFAAYSQSCKHTVQAGTTDVLLREPNPRWHHSLEFDVDCFSADAWICVQVMHCGGSGGPQNHLEVDQTAVKTKDKRLPTSALEAQFEEVQQAAQRKSDATAQPSTSKQMLVKSPGAIRWEQHRTLLGRVQRSLPPSAQMITEVPAPSEHFPIGCVLIKSHRFREAAMCRRPVQVTSWIRGAPGTSFLTVELEFRAQQHAFARGTEWKRPPTPDAKLLAAAEFGTVPKGRDSEPWGFSPQLNRLRGLPVPPVPVADDKPSRMDRVLGAHGWAAGKLPLREAWTGRSSQQPTSGGNSDDLRKSVSSMIGNSLKAIVSPVVSRKRVSASPLMGD